MFRLLCAAVIAVGGGIGIAAAAPASATPLCQSASVDGSLTTGLTVGPVCVPYPRAAQCSTTGTGVGQALVVNLNVCVPAP
jgi:hypothetical protein